MEICLITSSATLPLAAQITPPRPCVVIAISLGRLLYVSVERRDNGAIKERGGNIRSALRPQLLGPGGEIATHLRALISFQARLECRCVGSSVSGVDVGQIEAPSRSPFSQCANERNHTLAEGGAVERDEDSSYHILAGGCCFLNQYVAHVAGVICQLGIFHHGLMRTSSSRYNERYHDSRSRIRILTEKR